MFRNQYRGKRVLVTGHTGFKGTWLTQWLLDLGAEVSGLALDPEGSGSFYEQLGLTSELASDHRLDIRDASSVSKAITDLKPEFVFHLAAQALVRLSYREPLDTFATNVMGTAHILEAVRKMDSPCVVVVVTTDKCYENKEWVHSYREVDPMGGHDPYSASKGCAELVVASYRNSYFSERDTQVKIASARAGNVIGGGDWAEDRIIPDAMRALGSGDPISVRNPHATRPWQHVLEPLSGYLWLGAALANPELVAPVPAGDLVSAFNFGPRLNSNQPVSAVVEEALKHWDGSWNHDPDAVAVHEAGKLNLTIDKAFHLLGWEPTWTFADCVRETVEWYKKADDGEPVTSLTRDQLAAFSHSAAGNGADWAR